jgi:hypothetical protein
MITWFGQELDEIPSSYERIEPPPAETLIFRVLGYRLGAKTVHVKPTYEPREKIGIGLTVQRLDRPEPVREWLLVGPQPVAVLEPLLATPATSGGMFSLHVVGQRPFQHWVIGYQPDQEG